MDYNKKYCSLIRAKSFSNLITLQALLLVLFCELVVVPPPVFPQIINTKIISGSTKYKNKTIKKRVLVVAPHPDDETLGCAKVISENVNKGNPVKVVLMTNGDLYYTPKSNKIFDFDKDGDIDNIDYGYIRQQESIASMSKLRLKPEDIIFLGYPDACLLEIYNCNYNDIYINFKNGLYITLAFSIRNTVILPYKNSYHLKVHGKPAVVTRDNIIKDLVRILSDFKPTDIYVAHEFDFHDDHKATPLFLRKAIEELKKDSNSLPLNIKIHRYLIHFDLPGKARMMDEYPAPESQRLTVRDLLDECKLIPWEETILGSSPNDSASLDEDFKKLKHNLIDCYQTQVFDDYIPKICKGEGQYSWLHQFVKDKEEFWDWPIDYSIPFDYYDKLSFLSKIKHNIKVVLTVIKLKLKNLFAKYF